MNTMSMSKVSFYTMLIFFNIGTLGCNNPSNFEGGDLVSMAPPPQVKRLNTPPSADRKLLKTANISFETTNNHDTYSFVLLLCRNHNAYISNEGLSNLENRFAYDLTIRIPDDQFDTFIKNLEDHAGKLEYKNVSVQDVTEEFIDTEARLKTKKELEARYRDLLKQAKTVSDVISVEAQLSNVRADIEVMEGRVRYLGDRVNYSTLEVTFYEITNGDFGFGSRFLQAAQHGWKNLLAFFIGLIYLWPFLLLLLGALYFLQRARRWKKTRIQNQQAG